MKYVNYKQILERQEEIEKILEENTKYVNYKQIFARQKEIEKILQVACPNINSESGIYFLTRNEENTKYAYIGKGKNVIRRMVSHVQGYKQRIDISIRKRGFYSESNKLGWKLNVLYFPEEMLDEKERYYIDKYRNGGYTMYNIESGGTIAKEIIGERKSPKTYREGVAYGELKAKRKIKELFAKYLNYSIKGQSNKIKEKKLNEFEEWLIEHDSK